MFSLWMDTDVLLRTVNARVGRPSQGRSLLSLSSLASLARRSGRFYSQAGRKPAGSLALGEDFTTQHVQIWKCWQGVFRKEKKGAFVVVWNTRMPQFKQMNILNHKTSLEIKEIFLFYFSFE